jgi:hypothetical protein
MVGKDENCGDHPNCKPVVFVILDDNPMTLVPVPLAITGEVELVLIVSEPGKACITVTVAVLTDVVAQPVFCPVTV